MDRKMSMFIARIRAMVHKCMGMAEIILILITADQSNPNAVYGFLTPVGGGLIGE